jgi:adenosylhomocysteine nucleosidase
MKLGIIGAMEQEVETLLGLLERKNTTTHAGTAFHAGKLDGCDVVIVQCGIGKVNAALCVQMLCDFYGVTHLVNTGIAGSLDAALDIGDLVISEDAMYHDVDVTNFGYVPGQMAGMPASFQADSTLVKAAYAAAEAVNPGHTKIGRVASGDQFVAVKELKEKIIANTQGLCTEMEGAAIAQTAYRNQIPFVILRAISDKADDSAEMDYPTFERIAAHRCAEVTKSLARQLKTAE